ncbi:acyl-CoA thioesterase [Eoetvoesiella caeni]|uniref:Acyl-CoA thioester hydrolase n=1 Tax=Eoetvoesiella caeni TaxID=645616 RepID=A0A366HM85_9BURK|nr:acyl-CoA thioesterase [Eoetvoesiella caeni]MCI2807157.1 acyl-CoA thioesterase [Eoetvoesiella caeni]NYT53446.1 acyl-CoA thioesterase [Eoetvoesiella caeni]RBP43432.1 acyl-CoA thioester hydrolase [Eoetvoesiella caeni]
MQLADITSPIAAGGVFRCVMPMRWGDMDALGHVNNAEYFRYVQEARAKLFEQANMVQPYDRVGVLVHASCDFVKSLQYPGDVAVSLTLTRVGRSSLEFDFVIELQHEPGVVYARGKNIIVCTEMSRGVSSPWTSDELARFAACFSSGAAKG